MSEAATRWPSFEEATALLTAPGAPFEIAEEEVLGERLAVYRTRPRSLRELLVASAERGDTPCFVFDTAGASGAGATAVPGARSEHARRLSYAEHARVVASVAAALRERFGIGKGDRVAILAANCPEWIVTYWATVSLGAIAVGMNGWWSGDEIQQGLALARPDLLVADERRLSRLGGVDAGVATVCIEREFAPLWEHDLDAPLPEVEIAEDSPAVLLFTSGTTGRPKAVMASHRNLVAFVMSSFFVGARRAMTEPAAGEPGALLAAFPLFHVSGLYASATTSLAGGATTVWPTGRFDAQRVIALSQRENVTSWSGASTHVFRLLDALPGSGFDASRLATVGIGGSATTPELVRRTEAALPHLRGSFATGYGSTESGALVSYANNAMLREDPTCVGPPLPTVGVRIVDEAGEDLPDGQPGRILVRSPLVMLGYWRNPEADAEAFLPGRWLDTGDFGRIEDGRLYLASRMRDLILRGGENIYPAEVENRLELHPDVAEVAVVGVEHAELGQEVKAVVVLRPGSRADAAALRAWAAEALAYYKVPAHIEFREQALPRNATGKVVKHALTGGEHGRFVEQ